MLRTSKRRWVLSMVMGALLSGGVQALAEAAPGERLESGRQGLTRPEVIALSAVFPGLGQLAAGHSKRGTALVAAEVACLVVWLTSHEDYNTQAAQFNLESERYSSLRQGGSFEEAEESWRRLSEKKEDLDGSHMRRRLFGALAAAVYACNLVDVLVLDGAEPDSGSPVSVVPLIDSGTSGVAVVARF